MKINWKNFSVVLGMGIFFLMFKLVIPEEHFTYHDNGQIKEKYHKRMFFDSRVGNVTYFDPSGNIERKAYYKNGKLFGKDSLFYSNGKVKRIVNWHKGVMTDTIKEFSESDNIKNIIVIKENNSLDTIFRNY